MKAVQYDMIRLRAYEIWERSGCPEGLDKEHWEQAEKELLDAAQEAKQAQLWSLQRMIGLARRKELSLQEPQIATVRK